MIFNQEVVPSGLWLGKFPGLAGDNGARVAEWTPEVLRGHFWGPEGR